METLPCRAISAGRISDQFCFHDRTGSPAGRTAPPPHLISLEMLLGRESRSSCPNLCPDRVVRYRPAVHSLRAQIGVFTSRLDPGERNLKRTSRGLSAGIHKKSPGLSRRQIERSSARFELRASLLPGNALRRARSSAAKRAMPITESTAASGSNRRAFPKCYSIQFGVPSHEERKIGGDPRLAARAALRLAAVEGLPSVLSLLLLKRPFHSQAILRKFVMFIEPFTGIDHERSDAMLRHFERSRRRRGR